MAEALALKYRPKIFTDLVGQQAVQVILRRMVHANRVPSGLLFAGASGTGKTTTARILAAALNCEEPTPDGGPRPCGVCPADKAIYDGTSLDVTEIDAASNGLVDDIRALRTQVQYAMGGRCRVIILDEAHSMSGAAYDAILKTLEEPPPATVFLFLTTEPNRLPVTVATRLMPFNFRRVTNTDIAQRLHHICAQEQLPVEASLIEAITERAEGSLRNAVMVLDQLTAAGITTFAAYAEVIGYSDYALELATALARGDASGAYRIADDAIAQTGDPAAITDALTGLYKDILVLHAGGATSKQGQALEGRRRLVQSLQPAAVVANMKLLWDIKTKLRALSDIRSSLDLAIALITDASVPISSAAPPLAVPSRKLSLADLKAMHP